MIRSQHQSLGVIHCDAKKMNASHKIRVDIVDKSFAAADLSTHCNDNDNRQQEARYKRDPEILYNHLFDIQAVTLQQNNHNDKNDFHQNPAIRKDEYVQNSIHQSNEQICAQMLIMDKLIKTNRDSGQNARLNHIGQNQLDRR